MADKKKADKKAAEAAEAKAPGSRMKWIILGVVLLLLLLGGGGAAYYFLWPKATDSPEEESSESQPNSEQEATQPPALNAPPIYHKLDGFTVNLASPGPARFLRVGLTVVTQNEAVVAAIDKHMPVIRNDILGLLAAQEFAVLNTPEGKDELRESVKRTIAGILVKSSEPSQIQDVLFTDLVMQ